MKKKSYLFIPLIIFLMICGVFVWQLATISHGKKITDLESVLINEPFPNFKLTALEEGKTYARSDLVNGKPFLITVWATWCPTCYQEHLYLNDLSKRGIRIIGLAYKDDNLKVKNWLRQYGNPFDMNLTDASGLIGLDLGVYGAPETFLVDGEGIIRYKKVGDMNEKVWRDEILPIWLKYGGAKPQ